MAKFYTIVAVLILLALCAAGAFQYLEMEAYDLPNTLQERFFDAGSSSASDSSAESESSSDAEETEATQNAGEDAAKTKEQPEDDKNTNASPSPVNP